MKLILAISLVLFESTTLAPAEDDSSPVLDPLPFVFTTIDRAGNETQFNGTIEFDEDCECEIKPQRDTACSFAAIKDVGARWKGGGELKVYLDFRCQGLKDPQRKFCLETRALDAEGRLLAHERQFDSDNRIDDHEVTELSGFRWVRSIENSPWTRLPRSAIANSAKLDIRLHEYRGDELRHFPPRRHKLDVAITRPNHCGEFDVTFTNRPDWELDPPKHQIAFQVFVRDDAGKLVRADRRFLVYRADGKYSQRVRVEPRYYDNSEISISVYTRQPDNDKFIDDFFFGGSAGYSGCWTGDGGKLVELPIKGAALFDDLPAPSKLAQLAESDVSR